MEEIENEPSNEKKLNALIIYILIRFCIIWCAASGAGYVASLYLMPSWSVYVWQIIAIIAFVALYYRKLREAFFLVRMVKRQKAEEQREFLNSSVSGYKMTISPTRNQWACPYCQSALQISVNWVCPICKQGNEDQPFAGACSKCKHPHHAYACPNCRQPILITLEALKYDVRLVQQNTAIPTPLSGRGYTFPPPPSVSAPEDPIATDLVDEIVAQAWETKPYDAQSLKDIAKDKPIGPFILNTLRALAMAEDFTTDYELKKDYFVRDMHAIFHEIAARPPKLESRSPLTASLIQLLHEPHRAMQLPVMFATADGARQRGVFTKVANAIHQNMRYIPHSSKSVHHPVNDDLPAYQLPEYVKGTPFHDFFSYLVPLEWNAATRFSHTIVVGSIGAGKTTMLSNILLDHLHSPDPPGMIFIDPKKTVFDQISRLKLFSDGPLKDRLLILRPQDNPAINIFDTTHGRTGVVDGVDYLCSMLGTGLTDTMKGLYGNIANLLLTFPQTKGRNATILDLRALLVDKFPAEYRDALAALAPTQRQFFEGGGFASSAYRDTKARIGTRLDNMLKSAQLNSLFTSQTSTVDIYAELEKGSIIFIECGESYLDSRDDAAHFGMIFITEVVRAVTRRNALDPDKRKPAFMYIDEAQTFFKGDMSYFFTAARQCKVGGLFAFHMLSQADAELRSYLLAQTATKIVSKYSEEDATAFSRYLDIKPDELKALPEHHWACTIRGVANTALAITAPPNRLRDEPKMDDLTYDALLEANRKRVTGENVRKPPPSGETRRAGRRSLGGEPPKWTEQDEQALTDAEAQFEAAEKLKDWDRVKELHQIITELRARKYASYNHHKGDDDGSYRL